MGTSILKGITTGLLVTVLTLLAVLGTTLAGVENSMISYIVDFGLLLSCLAAGYRASRSSGRILPGAVAAGGYAVVGVLLLALYFPIDMLGALKIISEGTGLGLLAGVLGAGVLSSSPEPYERMDRGYYPRRDSYYDRKDVYDIVRPNDQERNMMITTSYPSSENRFESFSEYRDLPNNQESERARIYELCAHRPERAEINEMDEAFDWWEVETQRQLRSK